LQEQHCNSSSSSSSSRRCSSNNNSNARVAVLVQLQQAL
jgi:hypothetical protein